ncbi:uncharacterized protein LOC108410437 [Pygocentrus nattereri]|uniref:uncharacterized protein LOC108410437 n=1 Tax=Pygocentrus nattereri TaxID=42514 RepID=UPI0008143BD2|nr:uncharacterized protein LOC108410437 [Pygocentrus nattereri]
MVRSRVLVGLFLLSLLSPAVEAYKRKKRAGDKAFQNLAQIIRFLNENYLDHDQFAIAINIPAEKCSSHVKLDQNFLPGDSAWKVKRAMNSPAGVYGGWRLIGAKQKPIKETSSYHPEYRLLIQSSPAGIASYDPLLKKLLDKDKHGCVVFYVHNSPCVDSCSTPEGAYSILPALDMLREHKGPKAFVFREVQIHDVASTEKNENSEDLPFAQCFPSGERLYITMGYQEYFPRWISNIKALNAKVPLYRCDRAQCQYCVHKNGEVDAKCMVNVW